MKKQILVLGIILSFIATGHSQQQLTRILFIFDASQSMYGSWESSGSKWESAVKLMCEMVDSLKNKSNTEIAFRMYGHQSYVPPQDCNDSKLVVGFGTNNHEKIKTILKETRPRGTTPIAYSLEQGAKDFPNNSARNIIILITDGKEECDGDPCAMSQALQASNVILKPFIIGVGLDVSIKSSFDCVGNYYDANNEESFREILNAVISQALYPTSCQVNLLDNQKRPLETNVPMTFYDMSSGKAKYNFIHTLNHEDNPDTLHIDNLLTYRLVVHTLPEVVKDSITITSGRHNIIAVDAPQGSLFLNVKGRNEYGTLKCIVRQNDQMQTLHAQDFGQTQKYIVGKYDLEILSSPRIYLQDISVDQSTTTTIEIDAPGIANLQMGSPGYGSIFKMNGNELEFVCTLNENAVQQSMVLQPGTYKVIFRFRNLKQTIFTKDRTFTVKTGESVIVNLKN